MKIKGILKKLINIVPVEDTYFVLIKKPKDINLSKEVVYLNYQHLSPYKDGDIIYLQTKKYILIWFTKYKLPNTNKINIPEGYLIYKKIKNKREAIGITKKTNNIYTLSVVRDGLLISQIIAKGTNLNQKIIFLKKEHSLKKPEEVNISISKLNPSISDILLFSKPFVQINRLPKEILDFILISVSIFFILLTTFYFFIFQHLEKEVSQKTLYLNELKKKTKDIKELIYNLQEEQLFWKTFIKNEKKYPSIYSVLNEIMKVIKYKNGYINRFEFSENTITIWAGLKSGDTDIINDLLKTGLFKEIRINSSIKDREKQEYEILNIEIYLKEES